MSGDDVVRLIAIAMAGVLLAANLRGRQIGLSDGLRMAALWAFLFVAVAVVFTAIGW